MARKRKKYARTYNSEPVLYHKLEETSYGQRLRNQIKRKRKNRILIAVSIFLLAGTTVTGTAYHIRREYLQISQNPQNTIETIDEASLQQDMQVEKAVKQKEMPMDVKAPNSVSNVIKVSAAEVKKESEEEEFQSAVSKSKKVGMDYFSDAVFLGDSRTEGLIISTGLSKAAFYGGKGLTVDTAFTQNVVRLSGSKSKITPIDALKKKKFNKVYVMFGINELGWAYDDIFVERYTKLINEIQKLQPDAKIYVQSILPVSKEKETKDKIYNNKKIIRYNKLIKKMAENEKVYYIDVASAVRNKDKVLPVSASTDGVHLNKEYCGKWLDYIKVHTVK